MSSQLLSSKIVVKEESPDVRNVASVATSTAAFVGITEMGPVATPALVTSPEEYRSVFGGYTASGEVAQAIDGFFGNGGSQVWVSRTVHFTDASDPATKTSDIGTLSVSTGATAPSAGVTTGTVAGPWVLTSGQTAVVAIDAGSPLTTTFLATQASRSSSDGTFDIENDETLIVAVDGGAAQTIAFLTSEFVAIGEATAAEVAAVINAKSTGLQASVSSLKVVLKSDVYGTGSSVNVSGGTGNHALGFSTGVVSGTGNVADSRAVTSAEVKAAIEAVAGNCTITTTAGKLVITSTGTPGTNSKAQFTAASTATAFGFDTAVHAGSAGAAAPTLTVDGKWDGAYANALSVKVESATNAVAAQFNFCVMRGGIVIERFPNLTMDSASASYIETVVNGTSGSSLVAVTDLHVSSVASQARPATATIGPLAGGSDGLSNLADADFIGASGVNGATGLQSFNTTQGVSILAVPGRATSAVQNAMIAYAETQRDKSMLAVLDPPAASTATSIVAYVSETAAIESLSEFGAIYWPRIKVANPNAIVFGSASTITVAPSGYVAGLMARIDATTVGGVYTAPAGVENGILIGCLGFETDEVLDEARRDYVYPHRINPITTSPGMPRYVDGSRTLKGDSNFPSVSERRGVIFIEQSLKNALQWARHRNNDEQLRAQMDRTVTAFLVQQLNVGAFRSRDPKTAFFVDFGPALNPPAVAFAGRLVGRVGLATQKPAEFIELRFVQDTRAFTATA